MTQVPTAMVGREGEEPVSDPGSEFPLRREKGKEKVRIQQMG